MAVDLLKTLKDLPITLDVLQVRLTWHYSFYLACMNCDGKHIINIFNAENKNWNGCQCPEKVKHKSRSADDIKRIDKELEKIVNWYL